MRRHERNLAGDSETARRGADWCGVAPAMRVPACVLCLVWCGRGSGEGDAGASYSVLPFERPLCRVVSCPGRIEKAGVGISELSPACRSSRIGWENRCYLSGVL